jgi:Arc/MetJ-type ribon-helix-helix transcriptional regulator
MKKINEEFSRLSSVRLPRAHYEWLTAGGYGHASEVIRRLVAQAYRRRLREERAVAIADQEAKTP